MASLGSCTLGVCQERTPLMALGLGNTSQRDSDWKDRVGQKWEKSTGDILTMYKEQLEILRKQSWKKEQLWRSSCDTLSPEEWRALSLCPS